LRLPAIIFVKRVESGETRERKGAQDVAETDVYSTAQAAAVLGISESQVYHLARTLGIGRKLGRRVWLFTPVEVERMRQRNTKRGPKPRKEETSDGNEAAWFR
jgi:hypothetical protein